MGERDHQQPRRVEPLGEHPPVMATVPAPKITNSRLPRNSPTNARRASADASSSFTVVAASEA